MKKLFILLFAMMMFSLNAQKSLTPPVGLSFGMNLESAKQKLDPIGTFDESVTAVYGKRITYYNVKIGSTVSDMMGCKFVNDKLYEVVIFYDATHSEIENKYNSLCAIITDKYGEGQSYRNFKYPYEDKASDIEMAIKGGYANIATYWLKQFNNEDGISVKITSGMAIMLIYQHGVLTNEAINISTIKDKNAF